MSIWRRSLNTVKYMTDYATNKPLVVILGATGTGKSKVEGLMKWKLIQSFAHHDVACN